MSAVATGLTTLDRLDRLARADTAVHRLDPRAKVFVTAVFVMCVVSFGKYEVLALLPFAVYPVAMAAQGDLPFGFLARILLAVSPIAVLMGAFNPWFDRQVFVWIGDIGLGGGWVSYASILLRFLLTASAALVLTATTSFYGVCLALERLHLPDVLVTQLLLLYRYVFVLAEEVQRMGQARRLRSVGRRGMGLRVYGQMLGQLLLRTFARAQRIYLAMKCRGFDGEVRVARALRFRSADALFVIGWSVALIVLRIVNVPLLVGRMVEALT